MRVLDRREGILDLDDLGLAGEERERFLRACQGHPGAVLVTGPTGSGKTTTLYAALDLLNTGERSILTIEDPVEARIEGIKQMQVDDKVGVTFASGLRSMLRADPDVVMVGEMRDREAAQIGIEAALTGHLVLSTLHTNDAPSAVSRLLEMGVAPFLVADALRCIVAQRLVRKLCPECREPIVLDGATLRASGYHVDGDVPGFTSSGCGRCGGSGYRGRVGLYEVMEVGPYLTELIMRRASGKELAAAAVAHGMRRLREDGLDKVRAGVTSMAEVSRVLGTLA
jgi:type IV pilus assembly protein PilB